MKTWLLPLAIVLAVSACGGAPDGSADDTPATSETTQELGSIVTNGSFETGDFSGWTLLENSNGGCPSCGIWGIASDGQTITNGTPVFDFFDQQSFTSGTPGTNNGGSVTYQATDGNKVALQLQNGGESHRMFQTITLPSCQPVLKWDMAYNNHEGGFDGSQQIAVNIRDPNTDAILATPYATTQGVDQPIVSTMTPFQADLTSFSAQTVRLDYDMEVFEFFFDAAFDNIRVVCKGLGASPGALDYGSVNLGSSSTLTTTITNSANTSLTISAFNLPAGPFVITSAPSLPRTLAPNASVTVSVKFTPTAATTFTNTLTIVSNDPNGNTTVALTGVGAGSPQLALSTTALDFSSVQTGQSASLPLRLSNTGPVALTVNAASVAAPFSIGLGTPVTINPGGHVDTTVTFAPTASGPASQTLTIASNDPASPATVSCTGTGVDPALSLSTTELTFADQRVGTTSLAQTVTATNTGLGPVTVTSVGTTGDFTSAAGVPATLQPGDQLTVSVKFAPTTDGPLGGTLQIASTAATSPDTVVLAGTGIVGHISAPDTLAFGNQRVATTGTQSLVVTNSGSDTLTVTSIAVTGPYADTDPTPFSLSPGTSKTLAVRFTPTGLGDAPGTLTIASDDPANPSHAVDLTGTGVLGALSISPGAVNFGNQRVGTTSAAHAVTVTNVGTDAVTITAVSLGGPFAFTRGALPITLAAGGGSTTFNVTFSPTVAGAASSSLSIVSDAPSSPDIVPVTGTGIEPLVTVNPNSLAFGTQRTGTTSTAKTFAIKNTGTDDLHVTSLSVTGPFQLGIATPFTLAPNAQTTVSVKFAPTAPGAATGTVTIASDAKTNPTVSLTGTGTEPVFTISTTALAFGNQRVGTASAGQAITISNTGTAPLNLSSVAVAPEFTLGGAPVPSSILPGGHVTFTAAFAPTAAGATSGSIAFSHDAPGSPALVAVTGTGTVPGVTVTPSLDFGDVRVGTTSGAKTVTISNTGTDSFVVSSISISAPFARTAVTLPATVAPGGSVSFDVTFSPTTRTTSSSSIAIATDAGFSSVPLTGRGVAPLIAGSSSLTFGNVAIDTAAPLPLVLTNNGDAALTISALTLSGPQKGDYALVTPPTLPATVAAGSSLTVTVQLTPTAHGARVAQLAVASDALGTPTLNVTLTGSGTGAIAGVAPAALDLGAENVGDTTAVKSVTVTNTGETALVVSAIVLSGTDAADFATTASLPLTVAPGASSAVGFTMTPSTAGARSATATLQTNDPLTPATAVALSGIGTSPAISSSVTAFAFGDVRVGQTATLPVTLTNTGTGPLTLSALTLAGANADEVSVSTVALPIVLAPNGKKVIDVTFGPTVLGAATAKLVVTSDDATTPTLNLPITGNGVSPTVSISPNAIDFGGQLVGRTTVPRTVTIGNPGTGALTVLALTLSGSQATAFTLIDARVLPATIAPGGSIDIKVAFAPTAIAEHDATLTIGTDSDDAPTGTVSLTGLGISTALTVSPMSIDFGTVHAGTASAPTAVVITNLSHDPIPLLDGVLAGASAGDFQISPAAGTVAPDGGTATVNVTYAPAAGASSTATLTLQSSDPAIPQAVVVVSGRAVSSFLSADHPSLDFGTIEVGDRSGGKPVTITNTTTAPITVHSITAGTADFVVDATAATTTIAAGEHATFTVAFAPGSAGTLSTTVSITLEGASTAELTIAVTGEGQDKPAGGCSAGGGGGLLGGLAALGMMLAARRRRRQ